jgi:hypothetical protein
VRPTMSFLVVVVVMNAVATFWLVVWLRQINRPARLNKKAAKMLWRSGPIVPQHKPPNVVVGKFTGIYARSHREFFLDFKEFADVVNRWLAKEFIASGFKKGTQLMQLFPMYAMFGLLCVSEIS